MDALEAMKKEMFRRKLSPRTMKNYLFYVRKFLKYCDKEPRRISKKDCREFLLKYMDRELSWTRKLKTGDEVAGSSLNVVLNSLRFLMEEVLRKSMRLNMRYSKAPKRIPICLTKEEVKWLLDVIVNPKHRLVVSLMYGAGLRVSEVTSLMADDIYLDEGIGWVRHGKGNKDRPFIIPHSIKENLREMISLNYKSGFIYLFPGTKARPLSPRTVDVILKRAAKLAHINKKIHPHTLRHSFATHVLESGRDVTVVQALLGHNEARATMTYLHAVKPKLIAAISPLDELDKG